MSAFSTPPPPFQGRTEDLRRTDRTILLVIALLTIAMLALLGRVVQLQAAPSVTLASHIGSRTSTLTEPARRGDVLDRRGRLLAATHFGHRVFVDPEKFAAKDTDEAIVQLATVLGIPAAQLGEKIVPRMAANERAWMGPVGPLDPDAEVTDAGPILCRYIPIANIDDATLDAVRKLKIPGVNVELRQVRTVAGSELVAALVGKVGVEDKGLMGSELTLDDKLQGTDGKFSYVRDALGRPLWVEPGGYTPAQRGQDVKLAIDTEVQRICIEELERGVVEADAQGGRLVAIDPVTGEVLAIVDIRRDVPGTVNYDWQTIIPRDTRGNGTRYKVILADPPAAKQFPALARNRVVEDLYEPGSTFKPFMWAAATEAGVAKPTDVLNTFGGHWNAPDGRPLADVVKRDHQTWTDVLVNSSNIGMVQVVARLSFQQARDAILRFGFGTKTNIGLPGESPGIVTPMKRWSKFTQTSVAYGHEVGVTPLQMARAFSAFCRTGPQAGTEPQLRLLAEDAAAQAATKRVIDPRVAELTRQTMRGVTHKLDEKLKLKHEEGWQYELFGKSGTAETPLGLPPPGKKRPKGSDGYYRGQYTSSFVAGGPVQTPRLVMLCVIDDPGPERIKTKTHYGSLVAGPVVRRAMERSLSYLGVTPEPPSGDLPKQLGE
ncbi:MAG: peptidoglycan D,D-transpeptidase FtsI family protein [Phycisphaerales bacterium]